MITDETIITVMEALVTAVMIVMETSVVMTTEEIPVVATTADKTMDPAAITVITVVDITLGMGKIMPATVKTTT